MRKIALALLLIAGLPAGANAASNIATEGFVRDGLSRKVNTSDLAGAIAAAITASGAITTETDPTVSAWAKAATKPTYTATEVGARAGTWVPAWTDVSGKPTFATVATSGSYADLANKPTIPATGAAAGNVPTVGTALGTTANNLVATNASGQLIPTGKVIGTAAGNVPSIGTALGTTANNIVATNASGTLIPTGIVSTNIVTTNGTHTITGTLNVPTPTLP